MQTPLIPTSWGELLDKITILEIKLLKITEELAQKHIKLELEALCKIQIQLPKTDQKMIDLIKDLSTINQSLWDIEDRLREKERLKEFDADFIALARSVYIENDKRSKVKRQINEYLGSELVEEKSYSAY